MQLHQLQGKGVVLEAEKLKLYKYLSLNLFHLPHKVKAKDRKGPDNLIDNDRKGNSLIMSDHPNGFS